MSLLDICPGGTLLEPPKERELSCSGNVDEANALRERIKADLLPYQQIPHHVRLDSALCSR